MTLSSDPLCGIQVEAGGELPQVDPAYFPCCEGKGWSYCHESDAVRYCALQERLAKLQHLLEHPYAPSNIAKNDTLVSLLSFAREQHATTSPRGKLLWKASPLAVHPTSKARSKTPATSLGFSFAAACIWQLGISAMWIPLGENWGEALPLWLTQQEIPAVCWVEQRKPMWQRQTREDFAAVVRWCDAAAIPLWMELHPAPSAPSAVLPLRRRSAAVDQILGQAKSRPTLEWLDAHTRSRLEMVTFVS